MYKNSIIPSESENKNEDDIEGKISRLFTYLGAPENLKGRGYITRAIEIVYYDPSALKNVVEGLYSRIAAENNTTAQCVERDNRTFLRSLWRVGDPARLYDQFSYGIHTALKVPSARAFIAIIADKLRREPAYRGR